MQKRRHSGKSACAFLLLLPMSGLRALLPAFCPTLLHRFCNSLSALWTQLALLANIRGALGPAGTSTYGLCASQQRARLL